MLFRSPSMVSALRLLADCSPTTHFIASTTLDFPQPLGPRRAEIPSENSMVVLSAKDLNPMISRLFKNKAHALNRGIWGSILSVKLIMGHGSISIQRAARGVTPRAAPQEKQP